MFFFRCQCPIGFSGTNCQTNDNDCTPTSCLNHGICIDGINNYTCQCQPVTTYLIVFAEVEVKALVNTFFLSRTISKKSFHMEWRQWQGPNPRLSNVDNLSWETGTVKRPQTTKIMHIR